MVLMITNPQKATTSLYCKFEQCTFNYPAIKEQTVEEDIDTNVSEYVDNAEFTHQTHNEKIIGTVRISRLSQYKEPKKLQGNSLHPIQIHLSINRQRNSKPKSPHCLATVFNLRAQKHFISIYYILALILVTIMPIYFCSASTLSEVVSSMRTGTNEARPNRSLKDFFIMEKALDSSEKTSRIFNLTNLLSPAQFSRNDRNTPLKQHHVNNSKTKHHTHHKKAYHHDDEINDVSGKNLNYVLEDLSIGGLDETLRKEGLFEYMARGLFNCSNSYTTSLQYLQRFIEKAFMELKECRRSLQDTPLTFPTTSIEFMDQFLRGNVYE